MPADDGKADRRIAPWLRVYRAADLRPDIVAGLSLAAFVIPESLAYATLAGLQPVAGLYCYLVAGLAYALFGTSRQLAVGPTTLVVVALSIALSTLLDATRFGILLVGDLPRGLPLPSLPDIKASELGVLLPTAFACFLLAYSEAISVARTFAHKHGYEIDPERELTALGAANVATSLVRGFPVSGGMSQTAVNDMGGARSPLSLVVTSGAVALTLVFFSGLFRNLPEPVLGAIILMAAKHGEDRRAARPVARTAEFWIAIVACSACLRPDC